MMSFTLGAIKFAVTLRAIISGSSATNIIRTVKPTASTAAVPLAGMAGAIVGVEAPFAIQTIGSLRYGDYGLRLRLNMLLCMNKTTRLFIYPA